MTKKPDAPDATVTLSSRIGETVVMAASKKHAVHGYARLAVTGGRVIQTPGGPKHKLVVGGVLIVDPEDDRFSTKRYDIVEGSVMILITRHAPDHMEGELQSVMMRLDEAVFPDDHLAPKRRSRKRKKTTET